MGKCHGVSRPTSTFLSGGTLRLDVVTVGVARERAVVPGVVLQPLLRRVQHLRLWGHGGVVEASAAATRLTRLAGGRHRSEPERPPGEAIADDLAGNPSIASRRGARTASKNAELVVSCSASSPPAT